MARPVNRLLGIDDTQGHEDVTGTASPLMDGPEPEQGRGAEVVERAGTIIESALTFVKRHPLLILGAGLGIVAACLLGTQASRAKD